MALKVVLSTKAEVDALPEALRSHYKERSGKFYLDMEGAVLAEEHENLKNKLTEFRTNNTKLLKDVETFNTRLAAFDGVDPAEYKTLKAMADKLKAKGVDNPDDVEAKIQAGVTAALKPLQDKLAETEKRQQEAQSRADKALFRDQVRDAAKKAKVRDNSLRHVERDAEDVFELKDGKLVDKTGEGLTLDKWFTKLAETDDFLFEGSVGGGTPPSGNGNGAGGIGVGKPGAQVLRNPTPEQMGANAKAIASGDMVVQRD